LIVTKLFISSLLLYNSSKKDKSLNALKKARNYPKNLQIIKNMLK